MRHKLLTLPILLVLFTALFFPCPLQATENEKIKVGFFPLDGFNEIANDGTLSGYGYDFLMEIAKYTGWEYEFITKRTNEDGTVSELTFHDCITLLQDGEIDIMGGVSLMSEWEDVLYYPGIASGNATGILTVLEENQSIRAEDLSTLSHIKIGVVKGNYVNGEIIDYFSDNQISGTTFVEYENPKALLNALQQKAVDAVYSSNLRLTSHERIVLYLNTSPYYFVTSLAQYRLGEQLDDALMQITLHQPSFMASLQKKYYENSGVNTLILSEEEATYVQSNPVITVGVDPSYLPVEYLNENSYHGIMSDIMTYLSGITGLTFRYVDRYDSNNQEAIQIYASFANDYSWASKQDVRLTAKLIDIPVSGIIHDALIDNAKETTKIALLEDHYLSELVQKANPDGEYHWYATMEECVKAVNSGQVDVTYVPTFSADIYRADKTLAHITTFSALDFNYSLAIGVRKSCDGLLFSILNRAITAIPQELIVEYTYNNVLFTQYQTPPWHFIYEYPLVVIASVAGFFVLVLLFLTNTVMIKNRSIYEKTVSENKIRLALSDSHVSVWEYNLITKKIIQSENGSLLKSPIHKKEFFFAELINNGTIHPDDTENFRSLFLSLNKEQSVNSAVIRIYQGTEEEYHYIRITLTGIADRHGHMTRAIGISEDISDEIAIRIEYDKMSKYRNALTCDAMAVYDVDLTDNLFIRQQDSYLNIDGTDARLTYDETIVQASKEFLHPDDQISYLDFFARKNLLSKVENLNKELVYEGRVYNADHTDYIWVTYTTYLTLEKESGHLLATIVIRDIDQLQKDRLALQEKAEKDFLTGLANRDTLIHQANERISEHKREKKQLAVIMIDADDFKEVNDGYGHLYGDSVLKRIADTIKHFFRQGDITARLGGDEFMVVMKEVPSHQFVQKKVSELSRQLCYTQDQHRFSCSLGVAVYPEDGENFETLYDHADKALYQAKNSGKGVCMMYGEVKQEKE